VKITTALYVYFQLLIWPTTSIVLCLKKKIKTRKIEAEDSNARQLHNREPNYKNKRNLKAKKKINQTVGLETLLEIGIGSRIMLRRNINTADGLVNGTIGVITDFVYSPKNETYINKIKIKFDNISQTCEIERCVADYEFQKNVFVSRSQFPLTLAWAITIHKAQGLSLNCVLLDLGDNIFASGMAYVGLSRARKLENVHLIDFTPASLFCSEIAFEEYIRLSALMPDIDAQLPTRCNTIFDTYPRRSFLKQNVVDNEEKTEGTKENHQNSNDRKWPSYPIKFNNNNYDSYSNVCVQALIHLNYSFMEQINLLPNNDLFSIIFKGYIQAMQNPKQAVISSNNIRQFVANYPINSNENKNTNKTRQLAFDFLNDLIVKLPTSIRNLFTVVHDQKIVCECGMTTIFKRQSGIFAYALIDRKCKTIALNDCYKHKVIKYCSHCKKEREHMNYDLWSSHNEAQYVVFHVPVSNNGKNEYKCKIINYDPDAIFLPNDISEFGSQQYIIKAIIVNSGKSLSDNHFKIYVRNKFDVGWMLIDDQSVRKYQKIFNTLNNIHVIIFEKKIL
jgi:hypothetical protein